MNTLLVAATTAFLFVVPFPGSTGTRTTLLLLCAIALAASIPRNVRPALARIPRAVAFTALAWALLAAASLAWSVDRGYTLDELRAEVAYPALALAVFFLVAQDAARWQAWRLALLAGTALALAMYAVQALAPVTFTRHAFFQHRGPWSTHLVLVAPLLLSLGWAPPWGAGRGVAVQAAALALLLAAAWYTDSRIVWVAFGLQVAVAAALWRLTPSVAVAAVLVIALAFAAALAERNAQLAPGAPLSSSLASDARPQIWTTAWGAFREAPWLGHGFGRGILAARFAPDTPPIANHPIIEHAHNTFVNAALQLGLAGLVLLVALFAALAREYAGMLRRPEVAPLGVLGITLLAGFLAKNQTDDFLHRHNALLFWALNGMLLGLARAARAGR